MSTQKHLQLDLHLASERVGDEHRRALLADPKFGSVFTDHMVTIPFRDGAWQRGQLTAFAPLSLSPATLALHYGQSVFEGLKAYRHPDSSIWVFRPELNARRFAASAGRLAMPALPVESFIEAIDVLVQHDHAWVPDRPGTSLYLRPLMFATEAALSVRPANEYLFTLFASPVGNYFASGSAPVKLWVSTEHVRAAPQGTGSAKCAGNYAASFAAQAQARDKGCEQVLYLDAVQRRYIEELGGMNFFAVLQTATRSSLVTPDLSSGTLLPGVTRASIIQLARAAGYQVEERPLPFEELVAAAAAGTLLEAFACGTAAVITSIGSMHGDFGSISLDERNPGPIASALREQLNGIQYGLLPDTYGWLHRSRAATLR